MIEEHMMKFKRYIWMVGLLAVASGMSAAEPTPLILDMVHHNPGEKPYDSAYVDPAVIKEMGYDEAWSAYNQLPEQFSSVATVYTKDLRKNMRDNAAKKVEELRTQ
jgi:hypothetical protein